MQIEYLYYLVEIANIGSFSKATETLFMSQQRLSEIVARIEKNFNIKIFVRSKKGLSLTPQGKQFIQDIAPLLKQYDYIQKKYKQDTSESGNLKIVINQIVSNLFFENVIEAFRQKYPSKSISIIERENPLRILQDITDLKADLAITSLPPSIFNDKSSFKDLTIEDLFIDQLCCLVPADHPFAHQTGLTLEDVLKEPLILDSNNLTHDYFLDYYIRKNHLNPNYNVVMSGNGYTNIKMVAHHLGISFIFKFQALRLQSNDLIAVPIRDIEPFHFVMVYSNKLSPSNLLIAFKKVYLETIQRFTLDNNEK